MMWTLSKIQSSLAHLGHGVLSHVVAIALLGALASGSLWINLNWQLFVGALSCLCSATALGLLITRTLASGTLACSRFATLTTAVLSLGCFVNGGIVAAKAQPQANCVTMPMSTARYLRELVDEERDNDWSVVNNALVRLHEDVVFFLGHAYGARIEVAMHDDDILYYPSPSFVFGWTSAMAGRTYMIPGEVDGRTTAAGECWKSRSHVLINDTEKDTRFFKFPDGLEGGMRPTKSILCVPIPHPDNPRGDPLGVLSLASPVTNSFSLQDVAFAKQYADALGYYLSRCDIADR